MVERNIEWKNQTSYCLSLLYLNGLYGMNHHDIELLFSVEVGPDAFGATKNEIYTAPYNFWWQRTRARTSGNWKIRSCSWHFLNIQQKLLKVLLLGNITLINDTGTDSFWNLSMTCRFFCKQSIALRGKTRTRWWTILYVCNRRLCKISREMKLRRTSVYKDVIFQLADCVLAYHLPIGFLTDILRQLVH